MNQHIDTVALLILAIGALAGHLVYKHAARTTRGGDPATAITVAAAVIATLVLLLGVGATDTRGPGTGDSHTPGAPSTPATPPTATVTTGSSPPVPTAGLHLP
ncbi:hypothetical protein [Streptomyces liangshanensis]|uniref:hypothetical protein n=1 Tax=Streptomyces liangshanensis TaxID=2717324 RepID=UPI0036D9ECE6